MSLSSRKLELEEECAKYLWTLLEILRDILNGDYLHHTTLVFGVQAGDVTPIDIMTQMLSETGNL